MIEVFGVTTTERTKAGRRLRTSAVSKLDEAIAALTSLREWASYEDDDSGEKSLFTVFKTDDGYRWLSLSSNAFRDREGEIVSTKALQDAIEYGNRTGDRGTLRIFHIPGTDIGKCDFQGMEGRFLVESGLFDKSDLAQKAIEFFNSADEQLGVSIGFRYPTSEKSGGVYNTIRIFERSVCPLSMAANPWTSFQTYGGNKSMNEAQKQWLERLAGPDRAREILSAAATATKDLEESVSFKTGGETEKSSFVADLKGMIDKISDADKRNSLQKAFQDAFGDEDEEGTGDKSQGNDSTVPSDTAPDESVESEEKSGDSVESDVIAILKALITESVAPVVEQMKAYSDRLDEVESRITEAVQSATSDSPRAAQVIAGFRASGAETNLISDNAIKSLSGGIPEQPSNPVRPFIDDLLGVGRV